MRLLPDPVHGEVDLTATATELSRLARAVAEGAGFLPAGCAATPGARTLVGVDVETTSDSGVRISLDPRRRTLVISGEPGARAVLAGNLRALAAAEDGGHLHLDPFPDHPYLVEGSVPLVVNSPLGGMPTR